MSRFDTFWVIYCQNYLFLPAVNLIYDQILPTVDYILYVSYKHSQKKKVQKLSLAQY